MNNNVLMRITGERDIPVVADGKVIPWGGTRNWELLADIAYQGDDTQLNPQGGTSQKSFNGKAHVYSRSDQYSKLRILRSYQTYLCVCSQDFTLENTVMRLRGDDWSQTTTRHIQSFLHFIQMGVEVDALLNTLKLKRGGWSNRLSQCADIVIVKDQFGNVEKYWQSDVG